MKVFISWSGERSHALAMALRDWLPLVLHYVEPWLSEADVAAGDRLAQAVAKELESSNFGIIYAGERRGTLGFVRGRRACEVHARREGYSSPLQSGDRRHHWPTRAVPSQES